MVCLPLAVVAIEAIEPHVERLADAARRAKAPLAKQAGRIARFLQYVRHGDGVRRHWLLAFRHEFRIATHHCMTDVFARQQRATRRSAHGASGIVLREFHALFRQGIDVRRLEMRLAVTAQITIAEVVCQNVDHVGWSVRVSVTNESQRHQHCYEYFFHWFLSIIN